MPKILNVELLVKRRLVIIADLQSKIDAEDWHGAADACMDLRELDAQLAIFAYLDAK